LKTDTDCKDLISGGRLLVGL